MALNWLADVLTGSHLENARRVSRKTAPVVQDYINAWQSHTTALGKKPGRILNMSFWSGAAARWRPAAPVG